MLKDVDLKNIYSSGYNEPREFFTEALIESTSFDLGLGFFSSSGIRSLAYGFALFIARGGKMRIVINHILSELDKDAILEGQNNQFDYFESQIICDIKKLKSTLSCEDKQFFNCLSYLISINRIEFIATISTKGGLSHDKYGIFTDETGDKIAFVGSANFSKSALEYNGETITAFSSITDKERVDAYQSLFDLSWRNNTSHLLHIPMEEVKIFIEENFNDGNLTELIDKESILREDEISYYSSKNKPFPPSLLHKINLKEMEPRFPFPEERTIQIDAYNAWTLNNMKGLFAMATGSGKTVTALNCLLKQYKKIGYYKAIIVVPTQSLAIQWEEEAKRFNFQNIVSTHTTKKWKDTLVRYTTNSLYDTRKDIVLITTYATFNRKDIQSFLKKTRGISDFVYIADEAHNMGTSTSLKYLPINIQYRIGLSATPERVYDTLGSSKIYDFFNSYPPNYTYRYTMFDAIESNILCHYNYYPIFVKLTDLEMIEYKKITKQLYKFIDPSSSTYKKDAEKLLLKRKRIIHKAANKKIAVSKLLSDLEKTKRLNYTFVFVPEGYEPDYSQQDNFSPDVEDVHLIDEYAELFKQKKYTYYKYISGLDNAPNILDSFASGHLQILLSMKCLDEGVDIPRAENAIFCSSTGNPRQFVQRRGRVLRTCKGKKMANIWDLVVLPPDVGNEDSRIERNLFMGEVKRIVNFATLANNHIEVIYGELKNICENLEIDLFELLTKEEQKYI